MNLASSFLPLFFLLSCFPEKFFFPDRKEVVRMSREQIRNLTSLSSCAG